MAALANARRTKDRSHPNLGIPNLGIPNLGIMSALTHDAQPRSPVEMARSWRGDVH